MPLGALTVMGCTTPPEGACTPEVALDEDAACYCSIDDPARAEACDGGPTDTALTDTAAEEPTFPPPCVPTSDPMPPTLTMDSVITWDPAADSTATIYNPFSGGNQVSYFAVNLGPEGWSGDTTLPGVPDNWCFILWDLDGRPFDTSHPDYAWSLVGLDPATGITNCGRESAPGAGDRVDFPGMAFGHEDPVVAVSAYNWSFHFGGEIDPVMADVPGYFTPHGYDSGEFWGSEVRSDLFDDCEAESVTYGWMLREDGSIATSMGSPVRHTRDSWMGPERPEGGMYVHVIPWVFTFRG